MNYIYIRQHNIFEFDVPVSHLELMQIIQRRGDLLDPFSHISFRHLLIFLKYAVEGTVLHILHQ
jgi:hypothetical protein